MRTTEIEKGIFITVIEEEDVNMAIQHEIEKQRIKEEKLREFISNPNNESKPFGEEIPF